MITLQYEERYAHADEPLRVTLTDYQRIELLGATRVGPDVKYSYVIIESRGAGSEAPNG